jgi:cytosine/creatinine deaminase
MGTASLSGKFRMPAQGFMMWLGLGEAMDDQELLQEALAEARAGLREGGLPIGSVLAAPNGRSIARGHNLRVQSGDPTAHAETVCIRNAGRRRDWAELTLVSTLSPCIMCTGTALLYRIPRIIIGENRNFLGAEDLFRLRGVNVAVIDDEECVQMMSDFIRKHPDLWDEDIGK